MADPDMVTARRIAVVLPSRETFLLRKSGAVALCARDFQRFSAYSAGIDIWGAGPCEYPNVRYRRLEGWRRWWRRERDAYARALGPALGGYALIEVQNRPYLIAALRKRAPGAKLALHLHNDPQSMDGSRSLRQRARLLAQCDAIYCVSDFIRGRFVDGLGDDAGKVVTILNGVELPRAAAAKSRLIAFTGRVSRIKGTVELVRAFLAAELPGWRLAIAGSDPDGLLGDVKSEAVEISGQVSHAQAMALLAQAEIAAVPSAWDDPCPRAAIEALASGCALLTSRRGGLPEIAGDAGLYVDPADGAAFVAALRRLALDDAFRARLQAAGRARAAERFDIAIATARLDAARARLIGPP
ncbi:MAG: glycosyltransferase family 4 protein [Pseudomonadota bacterium]|nr:glycosyltransferase family 4 protein [Pseudomonadota bacterium]